MVTVRVRDLVVPPRIARLPRVGALPVPWATQWKSSDTSTSITFTDRGRTVTCTCQPGKGTPVFGQPCPDRQRRAVIDRLCSICGTPIKPTSQCAFMVGESYPAGVLVEPPTHPRCLSFALHACPVLASAHDEGSVLTAREYTVVEQRAVGVKDGEVVHQLFERSHLGVVDLLGLIPKDGALTPARAWLAARSK